MQARGNFSKLHIEINLQPNIHGKEDCLTNLHKLGSKEQYIIM